MEAVYGIFSVVLITIMIVLFAGEPDISDSLRGYIDAHTEQIQIQNQKLKEK